MSKHEGGPRPNDSTPSRTAAATAVGVALAVFAGGCSSPSSASEASKSGAAPPSATVQRASATKASADHNLRPARVVIDARHLRTGAAPRIPWYDGATFHGPGGRTLAVPSSPQLNLVPFDDGWLANTSNRYRWIRTTRRLDASGAVIGQPLAPSPRACGGLATVAASADGRVTFYWSGDRLRLHDNRRHRDFAVRLPAKTERASILGFDGHRAVYFADHTAWWVRLGSDGRPTKSTRVPVGRLGNLGGAARLIPAPNGGQTTGCRDEFALLGEPTKRHTLIAGRTRGAYSPNGRLVVGKRGYFNNALFVATNPAKGQPGKPILNLVAGRHGFIDAVWEDDRHLLVTLIVVHPQRQRWDWHLVRVPIRGGHPTEVTAAFDGRRESGFLEYPTWWISDSYPRQQQPVMSD